MARFSPYTNVRPNFLIFEGKTDEKGRLYIDFKHRPALYNSTYEVAVDKLQMDSKAINNVTTEDDVLLFEMYHTQNSKPYPFKIENCRIVTVEDLILELRKGVEKEGILLRIDVDRIQKKLSLYLRGDKFTMPLKVAKILNLVTKEGKISRLWQSINDDVAVFKIGNNDLQLIGHGKSDKPFTLSIDLEKNIWNEISSSSFQSILLHSDIVVPEFVGSQLVNILANFTYREKNDASFFDVHNHQWRRLSVDKIRKCFVQFSDSGGKPFVNVYCYLICRLRRRKVF